MVDAEQNSLNASNQQLWQQVIARPLWDQNPALPAQRPIYPIEWFKSQPATLFPDQLPHKFLSSGTTESLRSQSQFSSAGLKLYQISSVTIFHEVLKHYFSDPRTRQGYSLVPPATEWRNSSLAQMITWIAASSPVSFSRPQPGLQSPVWVFGTGFHFIELYDSGYHCPLPPGSIVIETGGTKGRTREVSRSELHDAIQKIFASRHQSIPIISEYGMCELACQAYEIPSQEGRRFRFPSWVAIGVQQDSAKVLKEGRGALVIHDPLRIDCSGSIRTQDLVDLKADGSFTLCGRLPNTVLKGCSLNAESLLSQHIQEVAAGSKSTHWQATIIPKRIHFFYKNLALWLSSDHIKKILKTSFEMDQVVQWAIEDLLADIPQGLSQWYRAVEKTFNRETPERWLIVSPQTHPLAVIYPVVLAICLNLKVTLRATRTHQKFFNAFKAFIEASGAKLNFMPSHERLDASSHQQFDACFLFGSDQTIECVRKETALKVQGFGSKFAFDIIDSRSLATDLEKIQKDIYSLSGLGCLSSRGIFIFSPDSQHSFAEACQQVADLKPMALPLPHKIRTFQLFEEYQKQGDVPIYRDHSGVLWLDKSGDPLLPLHSCFAPHPWCISVMSGREESLKQLTKQLQNDPLLYAYGDATGYFSEARRVGELNRLPWTGTLDGKPLFIV